MLPAAIKIEKSALPPEVLPAFDEGNVVTVTDHGQPVGRLVPDAPSSKRGQVAWAVESLF